MLGVVGSLPWSAVTTSMSRGTQLRQQAREPPVESFEVCRVSRDIVAVAVLRIEVDEVREDQTPTAFRPSPVRSASIPSSSSGRMHGGGDAAAGKEILDLPDRNDWLALLLEDVEKRRRKRRQRVVAAICRPPPGAGRPDERTRDDASDASSLAGDLVGDLAPAIQLVDRNDLFVRRDLEDAVGRRVNDRLAGPARARRRARR